MNKLEDDIESLLRYYVQRESDEERRLIADQETCELKVCLSVHINKTTDGGGGNGNNNPVKVHTTLTQTNQTPIETDSRENHFYIKSQTVSHLGRKSSTHQYYDGEIISIETVVTKPHFNCESVFKTLIWRTKNGKRDQTQRSFTREIIKREQKATNNIHMCLSKSSDCDGKNCSRLNNSPKGNESADPLKTDKSRWKSKIKKSFVFMKRKTNTVKKTVDNNINKKIPNTENLEPIKMPKKSIKKKLKDWMNRSSVLVFNEQVVSININQTRRKSLVEMKKFISTEDSEMEKEKPTNILARISTNEKTKAFEIIKNGIMFIDEDEEEEVNDMNVSGDPDKGISSSESFRSFNFPFVRESKPLKIMAIGKCRCDERRKETMIKYLLSKLENLTFDKEEIEKFDEISQHFNDCPSYTVTSPAEFQARRTIHKISSTSSPNHLTPPTTGMARGRRGSVISLNSEAHLDTVFGNIKFLNEIYCPAETISYFHNSKDYETYEKGMLKVLDTKVSLENMILFFYLTRIIVKQIDDPAYEENDDIKRVMEFSKKYLLKYYLAEISKHGELDKFILHSESVD